MGAPPKKPVNVPFGRNYAPTWAFDHIKYFSGGSEIQLHLDKYTGKQATTSTTTTLYCIVCMLFTLFEECVFLNWWKMMNKRYWIPVKGLLLVRPLQYANQVGAR